MEESGLYGSFCVNSIMNMQSIWVWLERGKIGRAKRVDRAGRVGDRKCKGARRVGGQGSIF